MITITLIWECCRAITCISMATPTGPLTCGSIVATVQNVGSHQHPYGQFIVNSRRLGRKIGRQSSAEFMATKKSTKPRHLLLLQALVPRNWTEELSCPAHDYCSNATHYIAECQSCSAVFTGQVDHTKEMREPLYVSNVTKHPCNALMPGLLTFYCCLQSWNISIICSTTV